MKTVKQVLGLKGGLSKKAYKHLLSFRRDVQNVYGDRLSSVMLFGSRARREAGRKSDVDVAVLLSEVDIDLETKKRIASLSYPYLLKGTPISALPLPDNFTSQAVRNLLAHDLVHEGLEVV